MKKCVLKNFAKFAGKQLRWNLFFGKVAGFTPPTLSKNRLQNRRVPINFATFFRAPVM